MSVSQIKTPSTTSHSLLLTSHTTLLSSTQPHVTNEKQTLTSLHTTDTCNDIQQHYTITSHRDLPLVLRHTLVTFSPSKDVIKTRCDHGPQSPHLLTCQYAFMQQPPTHSLLTNRRTSHTSASSHTSQVAC